MNKLYGRLARTNLKNNKPLYIPYILAGVMTVALFYLMVFLNNNPGLDQMQLLYQDDHGNGRLYHRLFFTDFSFLHKQLYHQAAEKRDRRL